MTASFRLMTVNLLHDRCDPSDFARVLAEIEPDVVVTQELGPMCADVLASRFPNYRLRPALGFIGRGIATSLDATFGDIDMPGRPATAAILSLQDRTVHLAGVHLLNPIQFPWWTMVRTRKEQLSRLSTWLKSVGDRPVVVAGDFNASPRWPAYRRMAGQMDDLAAAWAQRVGTHTERTWGWRPGWPRMLRIDHVFGREVEADVVRVVPVHGSDHAAVVADLVVADQSPVPRSRSNAS